MVEAFSYPAKLLQQSSFHSKDRGLFKAWFFIASSFCCFFLFNPISSLFRNSSQLFLFTFLSLLFISSGSDHLFLHLSITTRQLLRVQQLGIQFNSRGYLIFHLHLRLLVLFRSLYLSLPFLVWLIQLPFWKFKESAYHNQSFKVEYP